MTSTNKDLINPVIAIAKQASSAILNVYNTSFDIEQKDDDTPVTCADIAANDIIVKGLTELTPDIPIISEESTNIPFSERKQWNIYWLVDPLDGTREFIKRNGEFTVNIALIENHRSMLGVIHVPVSNTCYFAAKDVGAFKQTQNASARRIQANNTAKHPILIAGSRSHKDKSLESFLENIGEHQIISMGSSLKSCLVAEGKVDIYPRIGPTSEWDTAAAQCIVEEAGGYLTDTNLQPLKYNTKDSLLNPHFFVFGDDSIKWNKFL